MNRDHPRACGEHVIGVHLPDIPQGSSPRMRGTPPPIRCITYIAGIIPAHAGNTSLLDMLLVSTWDHPRACGEHASTRMAINCRSGSSPRMRGTLDVPSSEFALLGIIPAHAGNTVYVRR